MRLTIARWLIRMLAAWIPPARREEWREEWLAEIEHARAARGPRAAIELAGGAFADAVAVRRLRTRPWFSWTDVKLGLRMLSRYPGLAFVSVLGMAVAIAIGAVSFTVLYGYMQPSVPLPEGDRFVSLQLWDSNANVPEPRALSDFGRWNDQLRTVPQLGAYRVARRNLIVPGGQIEPVTVAEITGAGFAMARTPPLLGRPILEQDQSPSASPVLVIGFDVWRTRFAADPAVVGRTVRLGGTLHTIVGVMPEGFGFPVNFDLWAPLTIDPRDVAPRQGPAIGVFGRLAPGRTIEDAQSELTAAGERAAAALPETHAYLRPRVLPFIALYDAVSGSEAARWQVHLVQSLFTMILVLVGANVSILVYARTATRLGEISIRTALGATRARIVGQLFIEALVLSSVACALGLALAGGAMRELDTVLMAAGGGLPFWIRSGLSAGAMFYAVGLALVAASMAGVLPALQATGRELQSGLRQLGGSTGLRLGATWTALVIAQVAIAVTVLPWMAFQATELVPYVAVDPAAGANEYIVGRLAMDEDSSGASAASAARYAARQQELADRLRTEPGIRGVAYSMTRPGDERTVFIEIEGLSTQGTEPVDIAVRSGRPGHQVRLNRVDSDYFATFSVPVLAGRGLTRLDATGSAAVVVVNRSFAAAFFRGGSPLGRHIRCVGLSGDASAEDVQLNRWYEIVGVTADFPARTLDPRETGAKIYQPLRYGERPSATISLHVSSGDPAMFASRVREAAASVDPALRLDDLQPLDAALREEQGMIRLGAFGVLLAAASVLLLSAAGMYALMSFTVARRQKEIGIRVALGADRGHIVRAVFARAARQVLCGMAAGSIMALGGDRLTGGEVLHGNPLLLLTGVAVMMTCVAAAATIVPTRRALRVEPTDALRAEA